MIYSVCVCLYNIYKNNLKQIKQFTDQQFPFKSQYHKTLRRKIGANLHDHGFGNGFFRYDTKSILNKRKNEFYQS